MASKNLTVTIDVDTSQLDAALEKARTLARLDHSEPLKVIFAIGAAGFMAAGSQRTVTRRRLLGLGWLKR